MATIKKLLPSLPAMLVASLLALFFCTVAQASGPCGGDIVCIKLAGGGVTLQSTDGNLLDSDSGLWRWKLEQTAPVSATAECPKDDGGGEISFNLLNGQQLGEVDNTFGSFRVRTLQWQWRRPRQGAHRVSSADAER
ncbi:unnamed protein product [Parajaminaea phylloscopi]